MFCVKLEGDDCVFVIMKARARAKRTFKCFARANHKRRVSPTAKALPLRLSQNLVHKRYAFEFQKIMTLFYLFYATTTDTESLSLP